MLSVSLFKLKDLPDVVKAAQAVEPREGGRADRRATAHRAAAPASVAAAAVAATLTPAEEKRLQGGSDVFGAVCFACHGADGRGAPLDGAPAGTMMAPPLAGSPRVQGHRDYVIKVLLQRHDRSARTARPTAT